MREFITAVAEDRDPEADETVTWTLDGEEITFYKPTPGQFAIMAAASVNSGDGEALGTFIALFFEMADEDTQRRLRSRLFDRKDPFEVDSEGGIADIMDALVEHWSARPTKEPSDFQPSRSSAGKTSTARTRAKGSTSSGSRRPASSR